MTRYERLSPLSVPIARDMCRLQHFEPALCAFDPLELSKLWEWFSNDTAATSWLIIDPHNMGHFWQWMNSHTAEL